MTKIEAFVVTESKQFIVLSATILGVVGMTGILNYSNPLLFQRFIGEINPITAILEPVFQALFMDSFPVWATAAVGINMNLSPCIFSA